MTDLTPSLNETIKSEEMTDTHDIPISEELAPAQTATTPFLNGFGHLLHECLGFIDTYVTTKDSRIIARMFRRISALRRTFDLSSFLYYINELLSCMGRPRGQLIKEAFHKFPKSSVSNIDIVSNRPLSVVTASSSNELSDTDKLTRPIHTRLSCMTELVKEWAVSIEEIDLFLTTFAMMVLVDAHLIDKALPLASSLVIQLSSFPQLHRLEDLLVSKAVYWIGRVYELRYTLSSLRCFLMGIYRTSSLHRDLTTQAVSLNLLLRDFLQDELYDQAVRLLEKSPYPENLRSNCQHARYLYYLARINAVRLNYGEAHFKVTQAIRKAPQEGSTVGKGFRLAAHKLSVVIQLLMGDIPERRLFTQKDIRKSLEPYSQIVQAVRSGDLVSFKSVMEQHEALFSKDKNLILVQRLHYNVIRAGLRKITASYSCISIKDVAMQLGLDSTDDTNCIVSKAIADGVIDATIDFSTQTVQTKVVTEIQATAEPRKAFHGRIAFCLQLHNDALKAMQYPEAEGDSRVEEAEARRKEHQEQLARAEKDEFDGGDGADLI